jgi:hypothetical protein
MINVLGADFTKEKVKEAIMHMERNKAPGPDGLPAEFYQKFLGGNKTGYDANVCIFVLL